MHVCYQVMVDTVHHTMGNCQVMMDNFHYTMGDCQVMVDTFNCTMGDWQVKYAPKIWVQLKGFTRRWFTQTHCQYLLCVSNLPL